MKNREKQAPASLAEKQREMPLTVANYKLMLIGLGIIILGFILMSGGRLFFCVSSNLSNQDDRFCFRIILEHLQQLTEMKTYNRIAPDADSGGLSHTISC